MNKKIYFKEKMEKSLKENLMICINLMHVIIRDKTIEEGKIM